MSSLPLSSIRRPTALALRCHMAVLAFGCVAMSIVGCGQPGPSEMEWSEWRGGTAYGISEGMDLPTHWAAGSPNIRWKTDIPGVGNSSPVAKDGRVFLTYAHRQDSASGAESSAEPSDSGDPNASQGSSSQRLWRSAMAMNLSNGEVLWTKDIFESSAEAKHRQNTFAAPTPLVDETGVYVYFGSLLLKLDRATGATIWKHEIDPTYAQYSHYGAASSLAATKNSIIVLQDREHAVTDDIGWLGAFSRETGELQWKDEWDNSCCTYTTPVVVERGGKEEVFIAHSGALVSHDAETGERLWEALFRINQMVATPVVRGDLVGVAGGAHNVRNNVFLQLAGSGAETEVTELWQDRRQAPQNASPVLVGDRFFTVTDPGVLTARDALSGEILYSQRIGQGRNRSSMLAGGGKLYIQSTSGRVAVVGTGPDFQMLAANELGERGSNASPAVAGGCLLIRTNVHLHCIDGSIPYEPPAEPGADSVETAAMD